MTTPKLTSVFLLEQLIVEGASLIFHAPRNMGSPLIKLAQEAKQLTTIKAVSERAAGFMAIGYAQATSRPPVLVVSPGQGLVNAAATIYAAKQNQVPLIVIAEQQSTQILNDDPPLSLDNLSLAAKLTKWSAEARNAMEAPRLLRRAFTEALSPPKGPVLISVPLDIMTQYGKSEIIHPPHVSPLGPADHNFILKTANSLVSAQNPCIVAGNEVSQFRARKEVATLVEVLGCPVYSEPLPTGVNFPNRHPQFGGVINFGSAVSRKKLMEHDLVLALGMQTRISTEHDRQPIFNPRASIIQVNVEPTLVGKSLPFIASATADISETLSRMRAEVQLLADAKWLNLVKDRIQNTVDTIADERLAMEENLVYPKDSDPVSLFWLLRILDGVRPSSSIIVNDLVSDSADPSSILSLESSSAYIASAACIAGYAVPAAIGVKLATKNYPVIALTTAESFLQTPESLWSQVHHNAAVKIVMVSGGSTDSTGTDASVESRFPYDPISYPHFARAFNLNGMHVGTMADLETALEIMFSHNGPYMVDVKLADELI